MATTPGAAVLVLALFVSSSALAARPTISEDRELKEIDLAGWDCRDRLEGTAKTQDGPERNRLKNRSTADLTGLNIKSLETGSFLQHIAEFDTRTKGKRRKNLAPDERQLLDLLEKQIVSFTGYLVLAYAGPPETTNCGSTDFHDWHLELFEKALDHAPQDGDPTPVICEITPRTQNAIFRDNIRIQTLAGFIRAPDLTIEPTGHPAQKVRITGYLLWDDEHNGKADVGSAIGPAGANGYHRPWRSTAWEIHPAIKIEVLDGPSRIPVATPSAARPVPPPAAKSTPPPAPVEISRPPPQFVTVTEPVTIKVLYGETVIPRGAKLRVVSLQGQTVTVHYLDGAYAIPITSTDFR